MGLDDFQQGPISDWLDLAEAEAKTREMKFEKNPLTSKATFLINGDEIGGKVRTSKATDRNHPRIWHEYDDEPFLTRTHPNVITVALDLNDQTDTFTLSTDHFIVVGDSDRPHLPGSEDKPYFYIEKQGKYYYNKYGQRKYLPTDSWDAVFQVE